MRPASAIAIVIASLASASSAGCKFELDACASNSDCADLPCPEGEEPFCDFEGDELFGNCECRTGGGTGGSGGMGGSEANAGTPSEHRAAPYSPRNKFNRSRSAIDCTATLPRTLLPVSSSGGEKVAIANLPGATASTPPPTPLLPGSPTS